MSGSGWRVTCRWGVPIVSVAKGIENQTLMRPTQVLLDVVGRGRGLAALSGPNIAAELARYLPATAVAASEDIELAKRIQSVFSTQWFRVYTNSDVIGTELAGATKNVIAIAAGILDGLAAGNNAKAARSSRVDWSKSRGWAWRWGRWNQLFRVWREWVIS